MQRALTTWSWTLSVDPAYVWPCNRHTIERKWYVHWEYVKGSKSGRMWVQRRHIVGGKSQRPSCSEACDSRVSTPPLNSDLCSTATKNIFLSWHLKSVDTRMLKWHKWQTSFISVVICSENMTFFTDAPDIMFKSTAFMTSKHIGNFTFSL